MKTRIFFLTLMAVCLIALPIFAVNETSQEFNFQKSNARTDTITDAFTIQQSSTGTPAAGIGAGIAVQIEDAGGLEEQGSMDIKLTTTTDAAEDAAFDLNLNSAGTISKVFTCQGASSTTVSDYCQVIGNTTEANGVVDVFKLDTAQAVVSVAGMGIGMTYNFPDGTGTDNEEQGRIDVVSTDVTAASNESDMVFKIRGGGAATNGVNEVFRLVADAQGTTSADKAVFTSFSAETNGVVDVLELKSYGGTVTTNMGVGISIQQEDATSLEEKASIDFIQTDATQAGSDVDLVFSQNIAGTMTNSFTIDADGGTKILGAQGGSAIFSIEADQSDDAADTWSLTVADGGAATLQNGGTANLTIKGLVAQNATETADHVLTLDDCGSTQFMGTAGMDLTLPAATAGCQITFIVSAAFATTDMTIITPGGVNIIQGTLSVNAADVACVDEDTITVGNAAETPGDWFTLISNGTNWYIKGSNADVAAGFACTAT